MTNPGPLYTIPVYSWTAFAPAEIFSNAVWPESTPPTPIICIFPLVSLKNFFIKLVDKSFNGCPDNPPFSFFWISERFSRLLSVVLDMIIPSTLCLIINSIILLISLLSMSGESFITNGFEILFPFFILFRPESNLSISFFSWKSLKFTISII